jgi:hypothetical protein
VSFDLETTDPGVGEPAPVRVRGTGRGFVVGDLLTGTTEEWMALAVPMEESRSVELPRNAGIRIVSSSQGSFEPDGSFHVLLQNQPGPGTRPAPPRSRAPPLAHPALLPRLQGLRARLMKPAAPW